jgi:hypothetical protein
VNPACSSTARATFMVDQASAGEARAGLSREPRARAEILEQALSRLAQIPDGAQTPQSMIV